MIAKFLRNIFGGIRLALTLTVLTLITVVIVLDIIFNGISDRIYLALSGALVQIITFTMAETKRRA